MYLCIQRAYRTFPLDKWYVSRANGVNAAEHLACGFMILDMREPIISENTFCKKRSLSVVIGAKGHGHDAPFHVICYPRIRLIVQEMRDVTGQRLLLHHHEQQPAPAASQQVWIAAPVS